MPRYTIINLHSKEMKCYGCYLKNFKWTCRKFSSVEEADKYALENRTEAHATKLVLMSEFTPRCFENMVLEYRLAFPLDIKK
jgi:hypothetical protein